MPDLSTRIGRTELRNPVIAGPDGCVAVDARIRVEHAPTQRPAKSW